MELVQKKNSPGMDLFQKLKIHIIHLKNLNK